jgi:hypothetical protein
LVEEPRFWNDVDLRIGCSSPARLDQARVEHL